MRVVATELPEVLLLEPRVFADSRGRFSETFNARRFAEHTGLDVTFVQDNASVSFANVLRGMHYQIQQPQGKLVRAALGRIFDVAIDLRRSSPRFGQWVSRELDADSGHQMWIPAGFAHGFLALSDECHVVYKTTDYYAPQHEQIGRAHV